MGSFWDPFWDQIGPRGAKMGPREPFRASIYRKTAFANTLTKTCSFSMFWGSRAVQDSLGRPETAPKRHLKSSKTSKKGVKKWTGFLLIFGLLWGQFWGPFWSPNLLKKGTKNGTTFGTRSLRLTGPRMLPKRKINERGEWSQAAGFIFRRRKGGILNGL